MITAEAMSKKGLLDARRLQIARQAQASDGSLHRVAAQLGFGGEEEALQAVGATLGSALGTLIVRYFGTRAAFGVSFAARTAAAFAIAILLLYFPWRDRRRGRSRPQTP